MTDSVEQVVFSEATEGLRQDFVTALTEYINRVEKSPPRDDKGDFSTISCFSPLDHPALDDEILRGFGVDKEARARFKCANGTAVERIARIALPMPHGRQDQVLFIQRSVIDIRGTGVVDIPEIPRGYAVTYSCQAIPVGEAHLGPEATPYAHDWLEQRLGMLASVEFEPDADHDTAN